MAHSSRHCGADGAMLAINGVLVGAIAAILVVRSGCSENFTQVGNTKLLFVQERKTFAEAELWCTDSDSQLLEFWNVREWKDVCISKYLERNNLFTPCPRNID